MLLKCVVKLLMNWSVLQSIVTGCRKFTVQAELLYICSVKTAQRVLSVCYELLLHCCSMSGSVTCNSLPMTDCSFTCSVPVIVITVVMVLCSQLHSITSCSQFLLQM